MIAGISIRAVDSNEAGFSTYITQFFFPSANASDIDHLLELYPEDPTQGSPFDTGTSNALTPEFKRIAAFIGDFSFQAPRRFLLQQRSGKQDTWSFCAFRVLLTVALRD